MKGLFSYHSDDATYSYNQLLFVMNDEQIDTDIFNEKLKEMFPDIKNWEIEKMVYDDEMIIVYDDNGWENKIFIDEIECL